MFYYAPANDATSVKSASAPSRVSLCHAEFPWRKLVDSLPETYWIAERPLLEPEAHRTNARQHAPIVLLERPAAPSLSRRRRRMQLPPTRERSMKEQIDGNHQRQIDDRNHVDIGPRKAIARYVEHDDNAAHASGGCQHAARFTVRSSYEPTD